MIKFILILLAIICILAISSAAYTASMRREIFNCTNTAKLSLSNMRYRLDPDEELCRMGYGTVQTMNKCVKKAYENYDENQILVYETIMQYVGNMFEDPEDLIKIQNDTCEEKFPNYKIKPGIIEKF